ncbi:hypothetical protein [Microbacterium cremeum]|uniref:hypothetical protein n=1 Tax=Microbacterium cremeum TaxID=2782169 RepID=UPI0018890A85|nr:hypothetical protein [Microbacterium cremeum]
MSRRTVRANYPNKKRLSESEQTELLRSGPHPEWFEGWAERGVMLARMTSHSYGYFHVYSDGNGSFNYDFAAWDTEEGLRWGLQALHSHHVGQGPRDLTYPKCEDCRGVMYFTPDQAPRLHMVIEQDEDDSEADE